MRAGPWLVVMGGLWTLGGCGPRAPTAARRANPTPPPAGFAYDALADAQNARFALAHDQMVPAQNDLLRAIAAARRLRDETASLFLADAPPAGSAARDRLTDSQVQTLLGEARAEVVLGQAAAADRLLAGLEQHTPARLVPADLPLIRARESLELAQEAMSTGRYDALDAQLQAARAALSAYAGPSHAADASALSATLSGWLADPAQLGRLPLDGPSRWRDQVQGWLPASSTPSPTPAL